MVFNTEKESIDFFISFLQKNGFYSINATQADNQFSYYDIEALYKNKKCRFELKNRSQRYSSTDFSDSVMEEYKYLKFMEDKNEYDYARLVSFFSDVFTISDIKTPIGMETRVASKSTYFQNRTKVEKKFVKYKQNAKFNYYGEYIQ